MIRNYIYLSQVDGGGIGVDSKVELERLNLGIGLKLRKFYLMELV